MKNPKLISDYGKYPDPALNLKASHVKAALTGNPNFPTTVPSTDDLGAVQEGFATALVASRTGDRSAIAEKNMRRALLLAALRKLSFDIELQADGDRVKLLSSGLDLYANSDHTGITTPTELKVVDGMNPAELHLSCKRVPNAVAYLFEFTDELPNENTIWQVRTASSREFLLTNLRSAVRYYVRIKAVGRKGQLASSEISSRVVQ